jgi:hypothetical protein
VRHLQLAVLRQLFCCCGQLAPAGQQHATAAATVQLSSARTVPDDKHDAVCDPSSAPLLQQPAGPCRTTPCNSSA